MVSGLSPPSSFEFIHLHKKSIQSALRVMVKVVLRPKKQSFFFFGFQNYVN